MLHNSTLLSQAKRLAFLLVPALFLAGSVFAQPGTAFVSVTNISATPINFGDGSSWVGGSVPGDLSNVTISNCYMSLNVDKVLGSLTIAPGGYFDLGSSTLTIMDQFLCSCPGKNARDCQKTRGDDSVTKPGSAIRGRQTRRP